MCIGVGEAARGHFHMFPQNGWVVLSLHLFGGAYEKRTLYLYYSLLIDCGLHSFYMFDTLYQRSFFYCCRYIIMLSGVRLYVCSAEIRSGSTTLNDRVRLRKYCHVFLLLLYVFLPSSSNVSGIAYRFWRITNWWKYRHMGLADFMYKGEGRSAPRSLRGTETVVNRHVINYYVYWPLHLLSRQ